MYVYLSAKHLVLSIRREEVNKPKINGIVIVPTIQNNFGGSVIASDNISYNYQRTAIMSGRERETVNSGVMECKS